MDNKDLNWRIKNLSDDEVKKLVDLIDDYDEIHEILRRQRALGAASEMVKRAAIWLTIVLGGLTLTMDKIKEFIKGLV